MFKETASCQRIDVSNPSDTSVCLQARHKAAERPTLGSLWPAAAVALLGLPILVLLALTSGEGRGQYVVIAAPWVDRAGVAGTVHRAGAGLVASGFLLRAIGPTGRLQSLMMLMSPGQNDASVW